MSRTSDDLQDDPESKSVKVADSRPSIRKRDWWPIGLVLALFGIFLLYPGLLTKLASNNTEKAGQFGDSFGVLTSLFNGLAFAGLLMTIVLPSRELRLQREQLRQQKEELALQRIELKLQRQETARLVKTAEAGHAITARVQLAVYQPDFVGFVAAEILNDRVMVRIQNLGFNEPCE